MRRSSYVAAPLLASAALVVLIGCKQPMDCPTSVDGSHCAEVTQSRAKTIFAGFGSSFSEHRDEILFGATFVGVIWVGRSLGE
jgi:hypothetical protein